MDVLPVLKTVDSKNREEVKKKVMENNSSEDLIAKLEELENAKHGEPLAK